MPRRSATETVPRKRRNGRTATPIVPNGKRRKLIAFGWYGGKYSHLDWLLPLLPECHHFCEPFGGSAAVILNREPAPVETYNDLDGEVVNFFRVLRNQKTKLVRALSLTPFSREEFAIACDIDPSQSPLERARRFYIRARQVRTGLAQTASLGRWANCKNTSRAGMSGVISRWLGGIEALPNIAERLLRVQIENRPAEDVIRLYDSAKTLFYCDPPYIHDTRGDSKAYGYEMTDSRTLNEKAWWTLDQLCEVLQVCRNTAIKLVRQGMPYAMIGKQYRFEVSRVKYWLNKQTKSKRT